MHVLGSASPGGPTFTDLGELRGANNQQFGFRASAVVHPVDGALLVLTEGYAHIASPNFGFILLRSASGDPNGPWTEHLAYELEGRAMADDPSGTLDYTADPTSAADPDRWDCRLADPSLAVLADGKVLIAYRGTKCCCNSLIGAWNVTGGHELETIARGCAPTRGTAPSCATASRSLARAPTTRTRTCGRRRAALAHADALAGQRAPQPRAPRRVRVQPRRRHVEALSSEEAWPTHLAYDDCGADAVVKRQRPRLALDARRRGGRRTCSPAWRPPRTA